MTILRTNKGRDAWHMDDTAVPKTARGGSRQAQDLQGCTKATLVDGDLTWEAAHGGAWGNKVRVVHTEGATGVGQEDRPLAISADLETEVVTVTFGTDGGGASVHPTPAQVDAEAAATPNLDQLLAAVDGGSTPCAVLDGYLSGGKNDGDWLRCGNQVLCVNTVE